jgi:tetratricopeptide (TPR) repeat protein
MAYHKAFEASLIHLKSHKSEDDYKTTVWYALMSSDFIEALRVAKDGLSLFPEDGTLKLSSAHAMLLLGRKTEAIDLYKKAYADLQRSNKYADRAGQMMTDGFAKLISRYPDKAPELKWAEAKIHEPFDFNFQEIPFGEGKDAVLSLVKGAVVKGKEMPVLGRLDTLASKQLGRGLYPAELDTQLNPEFAEKYSVAYEKWGALQSVDLFFTGKEGQRTLCLVSKYYKESGRIDDIFTRFQENISKEIKIQPIVQNSQTRTSDGSPPLKIAIWKLNNTTIILDVLNVSDASSQLRILYVSKRDWEKYARFADPVKQR